ncbi:hypothetical protein [Fodinisporobacter ferrooxydans]
MKHVISFSKGMILAAIALPLLPILVVNSYIDFDTLSQMIAQFLS